MLKNDRGTILYAKIKFEGKSPVVIPVLNNSIGGIVLGDSGLKTVKEDASINSLVKFIKTNKEIVRLSDIDSVEESEANLPIQYLHLTVSYPDGSIKISNFEQNDELEDIAYIWSEELLNDLNLGSVTWKNDNWEENPALVLVRDGKVVAGQCDPATNEPC